MSPTIVITRPKAQAEALAADLEAAFGDTLPILVAPLMQIVSVTPAVPVGTPDHVIFTSRTGVAQAARLGLHTGALAWCVGAETAKAASALGFETRVGGGDSAALVALMIAARPAGEIVHLHGAHVVGAVVQSLTAAGLRCTGRVCYDQSVLPPSDDLLAALHGDDPLIIPLLSPRSAKVLLASGQISAPTTVIAISDAVANAMSAIHQSTIETAAFPDKNHLVTATLAAFRAFFPVNTP